MEPKFREFPKIPRLNRPIIVTEKIDGTNAAIGVVEPGLNQKKAVWAQSRKRLITPEQDNFGFARWVDENAEGLRNILGPGLHFGEWYGRGIQRGYDIEQDAGADGKFFALFNVARWTTGEPPYSPIYNLSGVPGLTAVPVLGSHPSLNLGDRLDDIIKDLAKHGSWVTGGVGYDDPEGIVIHHTQSRLNFKVTVKGDEKPKGANDNA